MRGQNSVHTVSVSRLPCLVFPVFLSPSIFSKFNCSRVFMCGCGFQILEQTAQNSKTPKGHSTAAVVGGLQTGFAAGQG